MGAFLRLEFRWDPVVIRFDGRRACWTPILRIVEVQLDHAEDDGICFQDEPFVRPSQHYGQKITGVGGRFPFLGCSLRGFRRPCPQSRAEHGPTWPMAHGSTVPVLPWSWIAVLSLGRWSAPEQVGQGRTHIVRSWGLVVLWFNLSAEHQRVIGS